MMKGIALFFKNICYSDLESIPKEQRTCFFEEIASINHNRIKVLTLSMLLLNIALLVLDLTVFDSLQNSSTYLFAMAVQAAGIILSVAFIIIFFFDFPRFTHNTRRLIQSCSLIVSILLCEAVSVRTFAIYGQILPYIIIMFSIACFCILNTICRYFLFTFSFASFNLLLLTVPKTPQQIAGFLASTMFMTALCIYLSRVHFLSFVDSYINRMIIINNIKEIGKLNADLENKVKERTEALSQANAQIELEKLRVSFFTNLSHEFRTPINVILSAEQLLEYKLKNSLPEKEYRSCERNLQSIRQYSCRLMRLASNIIDITKIDAGYYDLNLKNVDIVHVVEEIVLSVAGFVEARNISILFDTEIEELTMAIDVDKIERVLLNLLSNAVKFTPKKGQIMVSLKEDNGKLLISVKDSGIGIPSEMKDSIFNRFVQVDKTLNRDCEGSGLGLSIVKSITELHGGTITVDSEIYGGSEFIISLPILLVEDEVSAALCGNEGKSALDLLEIEFSDIQT